MLGRENKEIDNRVITLYLARYFFTIRAQCTGTLSGKRNQLFVAIFFRSLLSDSISYLFKDLLIKFFIEILAFRNKFVVSDDLIIPLLSFGFCPRKILPSLIPLSAYAIRTQHFFSCHHIHMLSTASRASQKVIISNKMQKFMFARYFKEDISKSRE